VRVELITGPPGSGKSTLARERMRRGDVLLDMDRLWVALTGLEEYDKPSELLPLVRAVFDHALYTVYLQAAPPDAVLVTSSATRRDRLADLGSYRDYGLRRLTVLETPASECIRRIEQQGRAGTADWPALVHRWWAEYQRPGKDEGWVEVEVLR
jgi:predicted kinase